ncbi:MAG TPA: multicopper oxidase family protein [Polyangiaceae bacterium]|nr:multicopper oxidase family protein [Polyangiaceae bacterium]
MSPIPELIELPATDGPFEAPNASDVDPAPGVVEIELEAKPTNVELAAGHVVAIWAYNGSLPGPTIRARVGDTLRVRFKNSLPEPTTIHWHGLRVPADMDGAPARQVPAGAEFIYEFILLDAGTFWYHPHVHSEQQVERGLYGAIVVTGADEPATSSDHVIVLDDVLLGADWQLVRFTPMQALSGRQGNLVLVNGRAYPIAHLGAAGAHRFRFINAANARYFRIALPGESFVQIGSDGGLLEAPRAREELLLVPGERADVVWEAPAGGSPSAERPTFEWRTLRYDRGHHTGDLPETSLFRATLEPGSFDPGSTAPLAGTPPHWATIPELPAPSRERQLRLEQATLAGRGMGPVFAINGQTYPNVTPLVSELGAVEQWAILNDTDMDHPFHLHGFRFQLVEAPDPELLTFRAWRDTVNVPARQSLKFRVQFEAHPGTWMFHCHILEHAENGMMGELEVMP